MTLRIRQHSEPAGRGEVGLSRSRAPVSGEDQGWWKWEVWLDGTDNELDSVESVTYILHPTFVEPIQVVRNRADNFRLKSSGWGEFRIKARVEYKDGREPARLTHDLTLAPAESAARKEPSIFISSSVADAPTAKLIRESLGDRFRFVTDEQLPHGSNVSESLEELVRSSDAVIAIVSGSGSRWVERELSTAARLKIPVLPVVIGKGSLPTSLANTQSLRIDSAEEVAGSADRIAETLSTWLK